MDLQVMAFINRNLEGPSPGFDGGRVVQMGASG